MGLKAMLTVDLHKAESPERDVFDKMMEECGWIKIPDLTTTWKTGFKDGLTEAQIKDAARKAVEGAAEDAKIKDWDLAVMVGPNFPDIESS